MNFSSHCASRVKEERLKLGLSQVQIAEKTGVSREMWGRYERGDAIPGGEVLFSFALVGADVQFIMTGVRSGNSLLLTPREVALLNNFKNMHEEDKNALERLASSASKI